MTTKSSVNLFEASHEWATRPQDQRFETIQALRESVHNRRLRSRSADVDLGSITAKEEAGTIVLNRGFSSVEPSHWSFGQLGSWIKAPAEYLRRLPQPLAVQCINHGLATASKDHEALKFMAVTNDDKPVNTLQAVTSTTYGRIWDADCVDAVARIQERTNGRFYNPKAYDMATGQPKPSGLYASDHDVFMFMIDGGSLLDAGPRAQLNRGFICWNSETGARTMGLTTFLFNVVCGNHIIWGAQDINKVIIRHTQNGPARFDSDAAPSLLAYAEASAAPQVEAIRKAQNYLLPDSDADAVSDWLRAHGKFSRTECNEAIAAANREEGDCRTLWHLVQGLTAYARGFDFVDSRVDLETRAGKLLNIVATN